MFSKEDVLVRKAKLETARVNLKKHFEGIDNAIDEIITGIEIWWCYPDFLTRPTVICLFGITGIGKTDLVRRLAMELGISNKYLTIELDSDANSQYNYNDGTILGNLYKAKIRTKDQSILVLDEIQRYRTKIEDKNELFNSTRKIYTDVWKLLSDGRLTDGNERVIWFRDQISNHNEAIQREMLKPQQTDGPVEQIMNMPPEMWVNLQNQKAPQQSSLDRNIMNTSRFLNYVSITDDDIQYIWNMKFMMQKTDKVMLDKIKIESESDRDQYVYKLIDSLNIPISLELLNKKYDEIIKIKTSEEDIMDEFTYSKMLIFISGNMDNIFLKRNGREPDIELTKMNNFDILKTHLESITSTDIKSELLKMFRPEQVSRFGNKYIIYTSLTKDNYINLIEKEIDRITQYINKKYDINISMDKTEIVDKVLNIGIYPSQGVRPVYSTISSVMGEIIPELLINEFNK